MRLFYKEAQQLVENIKQYEHTIIEIKKENRLNFQDSQHEESTWSGRRKTSLPTSSNHLEAMEEQQEENKISYPAWHSRRGSKRLNLLSKRVSFHWAIEGGSKSFI